MNVQVSLNDEHFLGGIVVAPGAKVGPAPAELAAQIDALLPQRAGEDFPPPGVKNAVRDMLRRGGFKPAGRNKPASEYLAQAAREGRFPRINNLVDINNLLSLESGLPISLLALDAAGPAVQIRYGLPGEKYVFNASGQEIDLAGLVCVCRADAAAPARPLGNPIKDSMLGKVKEDTIGVIGVIYGSDTAIDEPAMARLLDRFAQLLQSFGGAAACECRIARG